MIIKATIARSNPQCVRKIFCVDGLTIKEFAGILSIAFGFRVSEIDKIVKIDGVTRAEENQTLKEVLSSGIYFIYLKKYSDIRIILEVTEKENTNIDKKAYLMDSLGYMVVQNVSSVVELNEAFYRWENGFSVYLEDKKIWSRGSQNQVLIEKINDVINNYLNNNLITKSFNRKFAVSFMYLMKIHTQRELENLCVAEGYSLPIYTSKPYCEKVLKNNLCTVNFFKGYLASCPLKEYEALKELCFLDVDISDVRRERELFSKLVYLESVFLADINRKWICEDLLDYLETIYETEGDRELLTRKRFGLVISGACKLYGCVNLSDVKLIYEKLFKERKSQEELFELWDTCKDSVLCENIDVFEDQYFWDQDCMTVNQMIKMEKERAGKKIYIPDLDELEKISAHGVSFGEKFHRELVEYFARMFSSRYEAISVAYEAAKYVHVGMETDAVVEKLYSRYRISKSFFDKVKDIIGEGRKTVRQIRLHGFNEEECK